MISKNEVTNNEQPGRRKLLRVSKVLRSLDDAQLAMVTGGLTGRGNNNPNNQGKGFDDTLTP